MGLIYRRDYFNNDGELYKLIDLQNIVYSNRREPFNIEVFKFWYINNPCGKVISFNAYDEELMVAHYACIPIEMMINGRVIKGILSMATVTHPGYRGKGLFKTLAEMTYNAAQNEGYKFVIGVANANSFNGFIKHLGFQFVDKLQVKWGWGNIINTSSQKIFSVHWSFDRLNWRLNKPIYSKNKENIYGIHNTKICIKTYMGSFPMELISYINIRESMNFLRPFNLYIGLGADLSKGHYFNFPKFVKHSPFNLIFKDLSGGQLPTINKNNIFFQLIDFDVA